MIENCTTNPRWIMEQSPNHNVVPFKGHRRSVAEMAILAIDNGLEGAASITIEESLERAVQRGDMTIKEAEEYRERWGGPPDISA